MVAETLQRSGHANAREFGIRAVNVYDKRSKLVHMGKLPEKDLYQAEKDAKEILVAVLKAKLAGA